MKATAGTNTTGWRRGCIALVAAGILALVLGCGTLALGLRQGAVAPRWFDTRLGMMRLLGFTTWNPNCRPYTGCDPTLSEWYVVWVVVERSGNAPQSLRVLRLPIKH